MYVFHQSSTVFSSVLGFWPSLGFGLFKGRGGVWQASSVQKTRPDEETVHEAGLLPEAFLQPHPVGINKHP